MRLSTYALQVAAALVVSWAALAVPSAQASNVKIVMVHGLLGFGPTELFGVGYWGWQGIFTHNYYAAMQANGANDVLYAVVGKVSSNWDRMCELFAQIQGTKTDYGYWHALANNHTRFGPDYTGKGWLPNWGDGTAGTLKIHLVGHSMGGMTSKFLEHYLREGATSETTKPYPVGQPSISSLFTGGKNWIKSITAISSPFNGSPLATGVGDELLLVGEALLTLAAQFGSRIPGESDFYNFMLDQYAFPAQVANESSLGYYERVANKDLKTLFTEHYTDTALYDLTPAGCAAFNAIATYAYPDTFYFSHATARTTAEMGDWAMPSWAVIATINMNPNACQTGLSCSSADSWCQNGATTTSTAFCYDSTWEFNDGLVPLRSALSMEIAVPKSQYTAPLDRNASMNAWRPAVWYASTHLRDHLQIIGFDFHTSGTEMEDASDGVFGQTLEQIAYIEHLSPGQTWPPTMPLPPATPHPSSSDSIFTPAVTSHPTLRPVASPTVPSTLARTRSPTPWTFFIPSNGDAPTTPSNQVQTQTVGFGVLGGGVGLLAIGAAAWRYSRRRSSGPHRATTSHEMSSHHGGEMTAPVPGQSYSARNPMFGA